MCGEKTVMALDPATRTGFATLNKDGLLRHGVWNLSYCTSLGQKLAALRGCILALHRDCSCHTLVVEEASFGGTGRKRSMQFANEFLGVITLVAYDIGARLVLVKPSQLKKFATGSGNASKDQMVEACNTILGAKYHIKIGKDYHDAADAIWLLEWALENDIGTIWAQGDKQ